MQAVRQIYADLPDLITMPIEFRHRKVEIIILLCVELIREVEDLSDFEKKERMPVQNQYKHRSNGTV